MRTSTKNAIHYLVQTPEYFTSSKKETLLLALRYLKRHCLAVRELIVDFQVKISCFNPPDQRGVVIAICLLCKTFRCVPSLNYGTLRIDPHQPLSCYKNSPEVHLHRNFLVL